MMTASFVSHLPLSGGTCACYSRKYQHFSPSIARLPKTQPTLIKLSTKHLRFYGPDQFLGHCGLAGAIPKLIESPQKPVEECGPRATMILFLDLAVLYLTFCGIAITVYEYFPFPFFVSVVHLLLGVTYCFIIWLAGFLKFKPIDMNLRQVLVVGATCHALGLVFCNVFLAFGNIPSQALIKGMEPFLTAAASHFVFGHQVPLPLWISLAPVVIGILMLIRTKYINRLGFTSDMISTIAFTCRNILLKKAMRSMDRANVYAYISIIALFLCMPAAIFIDGPKVIQYGLKDAIAKVGMAKLTRDLLMCAMFYHLYFKVAMTTLEWVDPLNNAVGVAMERVIHVSYLIIIGYRASKKQIFGIAFSLCGVAIYTLSKVVLEKQKEG